MFRVLEETFFGFKYCDILFLSLGHPEIKGEIARKDDKLLSLLKDVYVDSKDPVSFVQVMCVLIE